MDTCTYTQTYTHKYTQSFAYIHTHKPTDTHTFALAYAFVITAVMCGLKIPRGNVRNATDMLRKTSSAWDARTHITLLAAIEVRIDAICMCMCVYNICIDVRIDGTHMTLLAAIEVRMKAIYICIYIYIYIYICKAFTDVKMFKHACICMHVPIFHVLFIWKYTT
jgi:hypothetical protein